VAHMYLALHAVIDMAKISGTMVRDRLPDRFEVVGRVKLGPVAAPSGLLDDPVRIAQFFGRHTQDHNLTDPHHHVPGDDLDSLGWKFVVPAGLPQVLVSLFDGFGFVVP